jgi:uncharacterized membrane protein (UPF0127 family)
MKQGFIAVGELIFPTLLASSEEEQQRGLMEVPFPPPVMTFVYPAPSPNRFWMHRTPSPLDIVFCCQGKVQEIVQGEPFSTKALGSKNSDLVIEFPQGVCYGAGIKVGDKVSLSSK